MNRYWIPSVLAAMASLAVAQSVELGAVGRAAVLALDPAASGGEVAAVRLGAEGEGEGARWSLGSSRLGPGLYHAAVTLRVRTPRGYNQDRLRLTLSWLADGKPLVERVVNAAALDMRPDAYTRIEAPLSMENPADLVLACRWFIEPLRPHETARPALAVALPQVGQAGAPGGAHDAPGAGVGLDDLLAELAAEKAVPMDKIDYPALLLDRAETRLVTDTLAVEGVRPAKVHVYPGEPNPVTVTLRNYTAAPREAVARFTMRTGLASSSAPVEARVMVPGKGTASHRFEWASNAREFGHEAHVELVAGGQTVHAAGDCFTVSAPLWKTAIQGPGFITWYGRENDFPWHVAANRRGYVNVEEAFSWQPSSWTDLNPTNSQWWSGQNNFHNSMTGLTQWMTLSHAEGIKLITYMWASASGPSGAEWARRHPDLVTHVPVGLASEFHDVEDLRLYDVTHERPEFWRLHYGVWHSFGINRGYLRLIEAGANEIVRSAQRFGWDGVRFDSQLTWGAMDARESIEEIRRMGNEDEMRRLVPEIMAVTSGVWNANAISVRNVRFMKHRLREGAGSRFEIASNYGPVDTNAVAEWNGPGYDYFRDYCAGGSQVNQEYFRHTRSWTNFYLNLLEQVERTRRAGGFHAVQCMDDVGGVMGRAYNTVFLFAAGSHPYIYNEPVSSPGRYARFMTRYGEYMWDPAFAPVGAEGEGWSVESTHELLWKPFLKRRALESGGAQMVLHLISAPVQDAVTPVRHEPALPWCRGVRVKKRAEREPTVWRLTAEPDVTAERLTVEREGDAFVVTIPEHRIWTALVWTDGEGRP